MGSLALESVHPFRPCVGGPLVSVCSRVGVGPIQPTSQILALHHSSAADHVYLLCRAIHSVAPKRMSHAAPDHCNHDDP
jgi:hypothetical protein